MHPTLLLSPKCTTEKAKQATNLFLAQSGTNLTLEGKQHLICVSQEQLASRKMYAGLKTMPPGSYQKIKMLKP